MKRILEQIEEGGVPTWEECIDGFGAAAPWLHDLESTPQDPRWHAEGNVAIHTMMVIERVLADRSGDVTKNFLAALLHDIAKSVTTKVQEIDGVERIVAPRHAQVGRSYLAYRMFDWGLDRTLVHDVLALVGHHHDWRRFISSPFEPFALERFRFLVDLEDLGRLEFADVAGRVCDDHEEQLEQISFFRDLVADFEKTRSPWSEFERTLRALLKDEDPQTVSFVVNRSRYEFHRGVVFTPEEAWSRSFSYREAFSHLVVLCGPSGCGKSSFVDSDLEGYRVISLDAIREEITGSPEDQTKNGQVRQLAKERLKRALADHEDVVWDATNLRRDFRREPVVLGFDYGAHVELVCFETSLDRCLRNNRSREREVPADVIKRQIERAEFPLADEAHLVTFVPAVD